MKVRVELFATLADFLPPASSDGRGGIDVPEDSTVNDVVHALGIPDRFPWIALVNGQEAEVSRRVAAGDVVTLFPPLAGGLGTTGRPCS